MRWCAVALAAIAPGLTSAQSGSDIAFELKPRICTMAEGADRCEATIRAHWRSPRNESLCLVVVGRADIKRCWEGYSEGRYSIELSFAEDLTVQLRDASLEQVLASAAVTVIREAIQLRRKRKQPWNILY
jgi:hypothetical protein